MLFCAAVYIFTRSGRTPTCENDMPYCVCLVIYSVLCCMHLFMGKQRRKAYAMQLQFLFQRIKTASYMLCTMSYLATLRTEKGFAIAELHTSVICDIAYVLFFCNCGQNCEIPVTSLY